MSCRVQGGLRQAAGSIKSVTAHLLPAKLLKQRNYSRTQRKLRRISNMRSSRCGVQSGALLLLLSCSLLSAHSQVDPLQHQPPPIERASHHGHLDKNLVQDKDHIMEHLEGVIDKPETDMTPQELQLHYFKMHDYDGNNLLDGLELATAISHVHKEEKGENSQPMKEEDLIALIDDVLKDDDKNNDGYIDYAEFAKSLE